MKRLRENAEVCAPLAWQLVWSAVILLTLSGVLYANGWIGAVLFVTSLWIALVIGVASLAFAAVWAVLTVAAKAREEDRS